MTMYHDNRDHESTDLTIPMAWVTVIVGVALAVAIVLTPQTAEAASQSGKPTQCDEAHSAPRSAKAKECRKAGWIVRSKVVISQRDVLRMHDLRQCRNEDGSGQRRCSWNVLEDRGGRAYVVLGQRTIYLRVCFSGGCRDAYGYDLAPR